MFGFKGSKWMDYRWSAASPILYMILFSVTTTLLISETEAVPRYFMGRYGKQLRRDFIADRMLNLNTDKAADDDESVCAGNPPRSIMIGWFNQTLDHFGNDTAAAANFSNNGFWGQHYQVNDQFFNKNSTSDPVIFLVIGGEGPINNKWVCFEDYTHMVSAKKHSAKVIQLEHRFFGKNTGLKDLSYASLQYLTTEQAMADIKAFINGYNQQETLVNPKWIAFGGSYPATIAALLRKVYPDITQGNIASSAPLYPVVDFWQYAQVMETAIKATNQDCYDNVKKGFSKLLSYAMNGKTRSDLNRIFSINPPLDPDNASPEDIYTVTSTVFNAFQGIVQYTFDGVDRFENKSGPHLNVQYACELMNKDKEILDRLNDVVMLANNDVAGFTSSYKDSIAPLLDTSLNGSMADMRGWMWLSCNEFGWLQSTSNNGIFGDVVPISYYIKMCNDLFENHFSAETIDRKISNTLNSYGMPVDYNGTNVYLSNGGFDPWSSLGVLDNADMNVTRSKNNVVTILTPNAGHCSDMYAPYDNEPVGLNKTRQVFWDQIDYYLSVKSVFTQKNSAFSIGASAGLLVALIFGQLKDVLV